MKSAAFQCPASGLIVVVSASGGVSGDHLDWEDMGAKQEAIRDTHAWIAEARTALKRAGARKPEAIQAVLGRLGVHADDLDPLWW